MLSKKIQKKYCACLSLITFVLLLHNLHNFRDFSFSSLQKRSWGKKVFFCFLSSSDPSGRRPQCGGTSDMAPAWGVLLTMCFQRDSVESTEQHKALYETVIKKWLAGTELPIFVIETSGYQLNFRHKRLWYFTFDDPQRKTVVSSTILEANALDRAVRELKELPEARDITHILKVTGRYFLEGVEEQLSRHAVLCSPVLLLQTHRNEAIKWQNSEYYGIRKDALDFLVHRVLQSNNELMEHSLFTLSTFLGYTFLGPGFTNSQPRGGDRLVINPL
jgi:hypothetical protein